MCAPTEARAWALSHVARLAYLRSDFPVMRTYGEEALSLWRRLGRNGRTGLAFTLKLLGELATEEGDYEHALGLFEEALGIYRELDDVYGIGEILMQFGWAAMRTGNDTQAAAHLEEFLAVAQQGEDTRGIAFALSGLGELSVRQGDYERAIALLEKSLRLNRAGGYRWMTATVLGSLGWIALARTDYKRMRALLGESLSIRLEIGDRGGTAWCLEKLGEEELARGKTALTSVRLMRLGRAVRIFAAAANLRAPIKSAIDPVDQSDHARNLAVLRAGLGEAAYAAAWAEGSAMSVDAAVDYALAEPTPSVDSVPPQTGHAGDRVGGLTRRECEVATLIAQGKSNREIAQALTVGVKTVETYVMRIFDKLGFDSRVQVATWAFNNGLAGSPRRSDA
jgi:DNA-binding CsgD family transcriptional regulator/tetratricopeptide (TPR) repeat protein